MDCEESPQYLTEQIITYIGNKRSLLGFIGNGLNVVKESLGKKKLACFDVFSGSGIVSRYLKSHSKLIYANDIELYSKLRKNRIKNEDWKYVQHKRWFRCRYR